MAWSLLANTSVAGASGGTTSGIDTTGADLIVISVNYNGTPTISDSEGNTWTALTAYGGNPAARIYYCASPTTSASHTFTISGTNSFSALRVEAWSGCDTGDPFDVENGATASSVSTIQPGSVTPTNSGALAVTTVAFSSNSAGAVSIDSGFTISDTNPFASGVNNGGSMAYKAEITGAENPTWDLTNGASVVRAAIAVFNPAAGGGGATIPIFYHHYSQMKK